MNLYPEKDIHALILCFYGYYTASLQLNFLHFLRSIASS